jgi:prolipoprotein diacylglyceryltransferase
MLGIAMLGIWFMLWGLIGLIATIWVIYDVLTAQKKMPDIEKLIWVLVAFFLGIIGAVIYYLIVKKSGKYEETEELSV